MLADNLLAKFQATDRYQRIAEGLAAIASGDQEPVHGSMQAADCGSNATERQHVQTIPDTP